MNRPASAIDAISPAIQHTKRMLFNPFDLGRWFILGLLSFLQMLGEGGGYYNGFNWGNKDRGEGAVQTFKEMIGWVAMHWTLVAVLGFFGVFFLLALGVLCLWLSAHATFCYIDCVATDRAEVVRPWGEHRQLADSYFFWRLVFALCVLGCALVFLVPIGLTLWNLVESGHDFSPLRFFFGSGVVVILLPLLILFLLGVAIVKVLLTDFVAPVQYIQRVKCSVAVRMVFGMVKANLGAFVLYIVMKILLSIVLTCAAILFGCATLCVGFCCMAIPIVGQTLLQPIYLFKRSFSLYFLAGFGPGFDVFAPDAPGGGLGPQGGGFGMEGSGIGPQGGGFGAPPAGDPWPQGGGPGGAYPGGSEPFEPRGPVRSEGSPA